MNRHDRSSTVTIEGINSNLGVAGKIAKGRSSVRVEYPSEGDVITRPFYTFNIIAMPEAESVDISIDHSDWIPCRQAVARWWYDWSGFRKGDHELTARVHMADSTVVRSATRRFTVDND